MGVGAPRLRLRRYFDNVHYALREERFSRNWVSKPWRLSKAAADLVTHPREHDAAAHDIQVPCKLNLTACIVRMAEDRDDALPEGSLDHAALAITQVLEARRQVPVWRTVVGVRERAA